MLVKNIRAHSQFIQIISSYIFLFTSLTLFYISTNLSILRLGYIFDLSLGVGVYSFIIYFFHKDLTRNIFISIFSLFLTFAFCADYLYFDQFGGYASLTEIDNLIWVSQGNSDIKIDAYIVIQVVLLIVEQVLIWVTVSLKNHESSKVYFWLANLVFIPAIFIVISVIVSSLSGFQNYQNSIGYIYMSENLAMFSQKQFIKYFGYLQLRLEMIVEYVFFLLRGMKL